MAHAAITWKGGLALAGYLAFFVYLSRAHTGPWTSKYDMPAKTYEQYRHFGPEFESKFRPDTHPALRKEE